MRLKTIRFVSILLTALALAPAMAHLLELPNKINLPPDDYLTVQQLYRGWSLLGIVVVGALFSAIVLAIMVRKQKIVFILTLIAALCIAGTQFIFWAFTYPVNQKTSNWTVLPTNWFELRKQWEYSHAASAALDLIALMALILSLLLKEENS